MPANAFTLFGTLSIDSSKFQAALDKAEGKLKTTKTSLDAVEKATVSLGQTSATSSRSFEKLNSALDTQKKKLAAIVDAYTGGKMSSQQFASAMVQVANATDRVANKAKDAAAKMEDFRRATEKSAQASNASASAINKNAESLSKIGSKINSTGDSIKSFGVDLTYLVTVPLATLGGLALASASKLDTLRNAMTAATGSTEMATQKMDHFIRLAQTSVGVFPEMAMKLYAAFKPLGVTSDAIDDIVKAFGRLKTAEAGFDPEQFRLNLSQLFFQNFELQDLKQAFTFFPRFGEVVARQFGFKASDLRSVQDGFKKLKETGLLSYSDFIKGIADAVNTDPVLGKLRETFANRLVKTFEVIQFALEPIGKILINAIEPALAKLQTTVVTLMYQFKQLPDSVQAFIVGLAAIAASLGPVLVVIGSIIAVVGGLAAAFTAFAGFIGAAVLPATALLVAGIIGVIAVFAEATLAVYALYKAYEQNLGGLRDAVRQTTKDVGILYDNAVSEWNALWRDHGTQLVQILNTIAGTIRQQLTAIATIVGAIVKQIGATIGYIILQVKLVMSIFGDFLSVVDKVGNAIALIVVGQYGKAAKMLSEAFLKAVDLIMRIVGNLPGQLLGVLWSMFPDLGTWAAQVANFFETVGMSIPAAIVRGIIANADIVRNAIEALKTGNTPMSPGELTAITQGFTVGAEAQARMEAAMRRNRGADKVAGPGGMSPTGGNKGKQAVDPYKEALKSLAEEYAHLYDKRKEQIYATNIELGMYGKLTEAAKQYLLTKARELDDATRVKQLTEEMNSARKSAASSIRALELEVKKSAETDELKRRLLELTSESYDTYTDAQKEAAAKAIEFAYGNELINASIEKRKKQTDELTKQLQELISINDKELTATDKLNKLKALAASLNIKLSETQLKAAEAAVTQYDAVKALKEELSNVVAEQGTFIEQLSEKLFKLKLNTADWATAWADSLTMAVQGMGDVFANAFANWDGTAQGFFKSIAQGFRQLIGQIIGELVRLMAMRLIFQLLGSLVGPQLTPSTPGSGVFGSAPGMPTHVGFAGAGFGGITLASGGLVNGAGTGVSDSIPAMLSNGEFVIPANVVKTLGVGFFEGLRNMQFAGASPMPSVSNVSDNRSSSVSNSNVFNINVAGGMSGNQTATMVQKEILKGLQKVDRRNR